MRRFIFLSAVLLLWVPSVARAQYYGDANALVDSWYRTYLGRAPDAGMVYWVNQLNQGKAADEVLAGILGSDEYYARAGSSPVGFLTQLYNDILKRAPAPSELNFWLPRMYTEERQTIADQFLNQTPGVWVGSTPPSTPPVATPPAVNPGLEWHRHRDWYRDHHGDWNWHHHIYEYRRPHSRP